MYVCFFSLALGAGKNGMKIFFIFEGKNGVSCDFWTLGPPQKLTKMCDGTTVEKGKEFIGGKKIRVHAVPKKY